MPPKNYASTLERSACRKGKSAIVLKWKGWFSTRSGARVIENCSVEDILTSGGTFGSDVIEGVVTNKGTIKTKCVVNCTGGLDI